MSLLNPASLIAAGAAITATLVAHQYYQYSKEETAFVEKLKQMKSIPLLESSYQCRKSGVERTRGLRILVIDGGGSKGLVATVVLRRLESALKEKLKSKNINSDKIHLADHFDLIAGTSAGGMISIGHGHCRLPLDDIEQLFLSGQVFSTPFGMISRLLNFIRVTAMYGGSKLEMMLRAALTGKPFGNGNDSGLIDLHKVQAVNTTELKNMRYDPTRMDGGLFGLKLRMLEMNDKIGAPDVKFPRVFAVTNLDKTNELHLLTNYTPEEYTTWNGKYLIKKGMPYRHSNIHPWEAARATSAAPGYFKYASVDTEKLIYDEDKKEEKLIKEKQIFWDGGIVNNSPISQAITEACFVFGDKRPIDLVVSVGTGIVRESDVSTFWKIMNFLLPDKCRLISKAAGSLANQEKEYQQTEEQLAINPHARRAARERLFRLNAEDIDCSLDTSDKTILENAKKQTEKWCDLNHAQLEKICNIIIAGSYENVKNNLMTESHRKDMTISEKILETVRTALEKCSKLPSSYLDIDIIYEWKSLTDDKRHCDMLNELGEIEMWKRYYGENVKPIFTCLKWVSSQLPGYIESDDSTECRWLKELTSTTSGLAHDVETLRFSLTKNFLYPLIYRINRMKKLNDKEKGLMLKEVFVDAHDLFTLMRLLIIMDRKNALENMTLRIPNVPNFPKGFQWISENDYNLIASHFDKNSTYKDGDTYLKHEIFGDYKYTIESAFILATTWLESESSEEAKEVKKLLLPQLPQWMKQPTEGSWKGEDYKKISKIIDDIRRDKKI